jgi:hypothetical protein
MKEFTPWRKVSNENINKASIKDPNEPSDKAAEAHPFSLNMKMDATITDFRARDRAEDEHVAETDPKAADSFVTDNARFSEEDSSKSTSMTHPSEMTILQVTTLSGSSPEKTETPASVEKEEVPSLILPITL